MRKKNSGLGRGLDAIFLENSLEKTTAGGENIITILKLSMIDPKSDQPRKYFDKEALEELAASIRENGLLQPILVREYGEGRYQIIAGERRFRACKLAEIEEIPAIILERDDRKVAELSLIENIQREDLNPVEEALAFKALSDEYGLTQEELAEKVGKSRSAIANSTRLLDLPKDVLEMVANGDISAGHGRTLLGLKNRENMLLLANKVVEYDLSVRQLEEEVKRMNKMKPVVEEEEEELPFVDYFREMELRIQSHLGRVVKIKGSGKKKSLTLFYEDNEDLDELDRITYTDYVGLMMSSVTTIINAITYVLVAFVAVSLIVSSIMIGVITLISVQERTKEIGILRAIGASKRNVSSMFNAETVIIGFTSGLLGVVITYLLCIPINMILHALTGIANLSAYLPLPVAVTLVIISVLLTLISGIIPSRSAAKKDPVVALRTE